MISGSQRLIIGQYLGYKINPSVDMMIAKGRLNVEDLFINHWYQGKGRNTAI